MNKLEKLKEKTMDLNDGIYCYYKNNEEMIIYPLFEDKSSIKGCIYDITG